MYRFTVATAEDAAQNTIQRWRVAREIPVMDSLARGTPTGCGCSRPGHLGIGGGRPAETHELRQLVVAPPRFLEAQDRRRVSRFQRVKDQIKQGLVVDVDAIILLLKILLHGEQRK